MFLRLALVVCFSLMASAASADFYKFSAGEIDVTGYRGGLVGTLYIDTITGVGTSDDLLVYNWNSDFYQNDVFLEALFDGEGGVVSYWQPVIGESQDLRGRYVTNLDKSLDWSLDTGGAYGSTFQFQGVATVPIPAAGWLFMSALIGLVGKKRLSRKA